MGTGSECNKAKSTRNGLQHRQPRMIIQVLVIYQLPLRLSSSKLGWNLGEFRMSWSSFNRRTNDKDNEQRMPEAPWTGWPVGNEQLQHQLKYCTLAFSVLATHTPDQTFSQPKTEHSPSQFTISRGFPIPHSGWLILPHYLFTCNRLCH